MSSSDVIVVGGGLVGTAVAYGLSRLGRDITVLDEGDDAFRASRGNFGLIWVHGKGRGAPHYARWTRESGRQWPTLAARLHDETGIDVQFKQPGGLVVRIPSMCCSKRAACNTARPVLRTAEWRSAISGRSCARACRHAAHGGTPWPAPPPWFEIMTPLDD